MNRRVTPSIACIAFVLFFLSLHAIGQQKTSSKEPNDDYQKGGKKVTEKTTFESGNSIEQSFIYDANGRLRETKTISRDGRIIREGHVFRNCRGEYTYIEERKTDSVTGAVIYYKEERYTTDNIKLKTSRISGYEFKANNGDTTISKFNPQTMEYEVVEYKSDSIRVPNVPSLYDPDRMICPSSSPGVDVSAGYSYVNAGFEPENESLHGWFGSASYNLNQRTAVGLKMCGQYKSTDDVNFAMYFLHTVFRRSFGKTEQEDEKWLRGFASAGIGLSWYNNEINIPGFPKFETDDKSISPLIGGGLDIRATKGIRFDIGLELIPTFFDDDTQLNVRGTAGVKVGLFRPQKSFSGGD